MQRIWPDGKEAISCLIVTTETQQMATGPRRCSGPWSMVHGLMFLGHGAGTGPGTGSQQGSVGWCRINFCYSAALIMERNHENKLSFGFKAKYIFSRLQQKWTWDYYVFITVFVQRCLISPSPLVSSGCLLKWRIRISFALRWKTKRRLLIPYRNTSISKPTLGILCIPSAATDPPAVNDKNTYICHNSIREKVCLCKGDNYHQFHLYSARATVRQAVTKSLAADVAKNITQNLLKRMPHFYIYSIHFPHKIKCAHLDISLLKEIRTMYVEYLSISLRSWGTRGRTSGSGRGAALQGGAFHGWWVGRSRGHGLTYRHIQMIQTYTSENPLANSWQGRMFESDLWFSVLPKLGTGKKLSNGTATCYF